MFNFSRWWVGLWVFSILFVIKIKLNTSRLIRFVLLHSSVERLGIPVSLENTQWGRKTQEERKSLTKTGNLLQYRHLHKSHKKSVDDPCWGSYDISQRTRHCSTFYLPRVINNPLMSKSMMSNLLHSKNKGVLTTRLNILAFLGSTLGPQTRVSNRCFFNVIAFNLLNEHLPPADRISFF